MIREAGNRNQYGGTPLLIGHIPMLLFPSSRNDLETTEIAQQKAEARFSHIKTATEKNHLEYNNICNHKSCLSDNSHGHRGRYGW